MMTDDRPYIHELALRWILKARDQPKRKGVRQFTVPPINFDWTVQSELSIYTAMIDRTTSHPSEWVSVTMTSESSYTGTNYARRHIRPMPHTGCGEVHQGGDWDIIVCVWQESTRRLHSYKTGVEGKNASFQYKTGLQYVTVISTHMNMCVFLLRQYMLTLCQTAWNIMFMTILKQIGSIYQN